MTVIKNQKSNTYEVRTYYKDWTGVRKQKTKRGFKRKCDAQEWERAFKLKENLSLDMYFEDFVDLYLNDIKSRIKYNTWLTKKHIVEKKILPYFSKKKLQEAVQNTMVGGATLTKLIGTSAWYAPGAAAAMMVEAILNDQKKLIPCSCYLEGEYGQEDICIGVPAIIGRKGIEKIVKIELTKEEAEKFAASADAVRKTNNVLHEIKAL